MIKFGLSKGCKLVVVKCGEDGAYIGDSNKIIYSKAITPRGLLDTTGAGDSFAGGFIGYLEQTNDISFENMKRAVIYGSAMASFCVEKFGTEKQPINFVFHGGSRSSQDEIREAIGYGAIKMNIDTDLQWGFTIGVRDYFLANGDYVKTQIGNPQGDEKPNKK